MENNLEELKKELIDTINVWSDNSRKKLAVICGILKPNDPLIANNINTTTVIYLITSCNSIKKLTKVQDYVKNKEECVFM